jgi:signal transduction histidine kinase
MKLKIFLRLIFIWFVSSSLTFLLIHHYLEGYENYLVYQFIGFFCASFLVAGYLAWKFNLLSRQIQEYTSHIIELERDKLPDIDPKHPLYEMPIAINKLKDNLQKFKHIEKMRKDFVANVSHEFKTPLTSILGYTETLLNDKELPSETHERFLNKISKNATLLKNLVEDVLQLSRIESGTVELSLQTIDVVQFIQNIVSEFSEKAVKKDQLILVEMRDEFLKLAVDVQSFEQILSNLISNAIKYTPAGGEINIGAYEKGDEVCILVKDNGIGISKKDQVRIFERFYRVDKGRSREAGGTGLGLAIVKHLAQAHGGTVCLESELGNGCKFTVCLPRNI